MKDLLSEICFVSTLDRDLKINYYYSEEDMVAASTTTRHILVTTCQYEADGLTFSKPTHKSQIHPSKILEF